MDTKQPTPENIDEYIATFPPNVQEILEKVRLTIREAAPEAVETISYKMPTFKLNGTYLIYFAGYKKHIGLYPLPGENAAFDEELSTYKSGKGTAKFPLDRPIPYDLIAKIVKFRAKENLEKTKRKQKRV